MATSPAASFRSRPWLRIFPGFPTAFSGPDLIENMRKQAQRFGAEFKAGAITDVDLSKRPFKITAGNDTYETRALDHRLGRDRAHDGPRVRAQTDRLWRLHLRHLRRLFFPRQGDRGRRRRRFGDGRGEFSFRFASKVYLVHRRKEFRASKIMVDRARANEKIQFVTPVVVEDISDVSKGGVET